MLAGGLAEVDIDSVLIVGDQLGILIINSLNCSLSEPKLLAQIPSLSPTIS
jgi:hypothetical protein